MLPSVMACFIYLGVDNSPAVEVVGQIQRSSEEAAADKRPVEWASGGLAWVELSDIHMNQNIR